MMRNLMLGPLLMLAVGVVLANEVPEDKAVPAGDTAQPQAKDVQAREDNARDGTETQPESEEAVAAQSEQAQASPENAQDGTPSGPKTVSGMSILGNQEAPKSLVIVPWKSSEIGDSLAISTLLDDSRQPIDREVFLRALSYYEIMSERTP